MVPLTALIVGARAELLRNGQNIGLQLVLDWYGRFCYGKFDLNYHPGRNDYKIIP